MERFFRVLLVTGLVVFLSFFAVGCAKKQVPTDVEVTPAEAPADAEVQQAAERDIRESGMAAESESLDTRAQAFEDKYPVLEGRTNAPLLPIYFDFDKSNIRKDQRARLETDAEFLAQNKAVRVRIEGNCDERGTNEYNMALGQRRALSAKKYLVNLGIDAKRMETISYGEEKSLLFGHDEYSWAQNRRDDFVIMK
jgi:peptidoglycan-associated lipoprotein